MGKYEIQTIQKLGSFKKMFSLEGKVALVTGAAGGIGRSTAAGMAELGAKVVLMDIPAAEETLKQNVKDIEDRYGAEAMYVLGDVSDPDSVDQFLKSAVERFGTLDIVHNNAGVRVRPDNSGMSYEAWCKSVSVNLTGAFLVARASAQIMKEHGHGGSIITTASMSGLIVNTGVAYATTKAGVEHMSNALAVEYAKYGIRFNAVCYGYVLSGLQEKFDMPREALDELYDWMGNAAPLGRCAALEEIVGVVLYLATDLSSFQTASSVVVDGGFCMDRVRNRDTIS